MRQYTVGVVGVGLIGGSIAKRIKFSGFANKVIGIGRSIERLEKAKSLGIVDEISDSYSAISDADLIVISTPIAHIISHLPKILESAKEGTVLIDVGSVKVPICQRYQVIKGNYPGVWFIPSHPIAGSHKRGFENALKDLFMGRPAVLCPSDDVPPDVIDLVRRFYNFLGMDVFIMSPEEHDSILAYTSHLPHLISFSYRDILRDSHLRLSGGSLRDLTRISYADLHLWNGIFRANADNLIKSGQEFLEAFSEKMQAIQEDRDVVVGYLPEPEEDGVYTVAIDGPAGAGKSTIAKLLAMKLGFRLIDTGAMYRAGTLSCMRRGINLESVSDVLSCIQSSSIELTESIPPRVLLNGEDVSEEIRRPEVTSNVVFLAREPKVREYMVAIQREMALKGRAVIEGRDITTVVIPEARFKFYLDASFDVRVERRYNELKQKKIDIDKEHLLEDMLARDASDLSRDVGPLRRAKDAFYIDSSNLSIEHTLNVIYYEIKRRIANEEIKI